MTQDNAATKALNSAKYKLEEDIEDRQRSDTMLQNEVVKIRSTLQAAELGLERHRAGTDLLRRELSEVKSALVLVGKQP